jgi:uncharacterized protein
MDALPLVLNGATLLADLSGALWWPERRLLAVSDLHLEKGSHFARRGVPLPPYDTAATLAALGAVLSRYQPATVVCVGDSFHDVDAEERLDDDAIATLGTMTAARDWVWIAGNHDPLPPGRLGGRVSGEVTVGPLVFRHEARPGPAAGEVSGHFHPKARLHVRGRGIAGRCFVSDGRRLMLPAFGAFAGGLDVSSPEISRLFGRRGEILFLGRGRMLRLPMDRGTDRRRAAAS